MDSLWTSAFWKAAVERAIKSAAQALIIVWGVADGLLNVFALDWKQALGVAGGMAIASIVTSIASIPAGSGGGPSFGGAEVPNPAPPVNP